MILVFILILIIIIGALFRGLSMGDMFRGLSMGAGRRNYYLEMSREMFAVDMDTILAMQQVQNYITKVNPAAREFILNYKNLSITDKLSEVQLVMLITKMYIKLKEPSMRSMASQPNVFPTMIMPPGMHVHGYFNTTEHDELLKWVQGAFGTEVYAARNVHHAILPNSIINPQEKFRLSNKYKQLASAILGQRPEFDRLIAYLCAEYDCTAEDIRVIFTRQTSTDGIKMHFDSLMNTPGPIATVNLAVPTAYDMYPVFTNRHYRPIRVPIRPGDLTIWTDEAKIEWMHSIPDGMPRANERYAILLKIQQEYIPAYWYDPQTQQTMTMAMNDQSIILYHPRLFQHYDDYYYNDPWIIKECTRLHQLSTEGKHYIILPHVVRLYIQHNQCDAEWCSTAYTHIMANWSTGMEAYGSRVFINMAPHLYDRGSLGVNNYDRDLLDNTAVALIITPMELNHPSWVEYVKGRIPRYQLFYTLEWVNEPLRVYERARSTSL